LYPASPEPPVSVTEDQVNETEVAVTVGEFSVGFPGAV
jgi:hypothetical protein